MIEELKDARVKLDGMCGICSSIKQYSIKNSGSNIRFGEMECVESLFKEIQESTKYINSAKKWVALLLHYLGETNIGDGKSLPISLFAQTNETKPLGAATRPFNHKETIDWLKMELGILIKLFEMPYPYMTEAFNCKNRIWSDLNDAIMMLDEYSENH